MGVTLYYRGRLAKGVSLNSLFAEAESIAFANGWTIRRLPSGGFIIQSHPDCEPLTFNPDGKGKVDDWVKTQYAGPEVHIQISEFLSRVSTFFAKLKVDDDTEYWVTRNRDDLERGFGQVNEMLKEIVRENPNARTIVRLPNGRIVDVLE